MTSVSGYLTLTSTAYGAIHLEPTSTFVAVQHRHSKIANFIGIGFAKLPLYFCNTNYQFHYLYYYNVPCVENLNLSRICKLKQLLLGAPGFHAYQNIT